MIIPAIGFLSAIAVSISSVLLVDFLKQPRLYFEIDSSKEIEERNESKKRLRLKVKNLPFSYRITRGIWSGRAATNCEAEFKLDKAEVICEHEEEENTHTFFANIKRQARWDSDATPHQYQIVEENQDIDAKLYSIPNNVFSEILTESSIAPGESESILLAEKFAGRDYFYMISAFGYTKLQRRSFRNSKRTGLLVPDETEIVGEIDNVELDVSDSDSSSESISQYGRRRIMNEELVVNIIATENSGGFNKENLSIENRSNRLEDFTLNH